jgi:diguanylate cyclase (GGDEF)-like protein/PAS domain S-box-containing protein
MNAPDPLRALLAGPPLEEVPAASTLLRAEGRIVQDAAGRVIDCDASAETLLDRPREQLVGQADITALCHMVDAEGKALGARHWPALQALAEQAPVAEQVVGIGLADGRRRWLSVHAMPLQRGQGAGAVVVHLAELPPERAGQQRLLAQWQLLRSALRASGATPWEWDLRTDRLRADADWASLMGWSVGSHAWVPRAEFQAVAHPEDLAASDKVLREHLSQRRDDHVSELRLRQADGRWRWLLSRGRVVQRDANGRALQMVGTHEDITARKEAELAARHALGMLQGLFDCAPIGISQLDLASGRTVDFNPALCTLLGRSREALLAEGDLGRYLDPVDRDRRLALLRQAAETGTYGPLDATMHAADGRRFAVVIRGARVIGPDGRTYLWCLTQDLSARKALEAELRAAAEQDPLTGLPNRHALMQRLARLLEPGPHLRPQRFALLFLDLERFKMVNDTLGHDAGDELLVQLARRLRTVVTAGGAGDRTDTLLARFGGDEFVCLACGIDGETEARAVADRLHAALLQPFRVKGQDIESGVSIGIAMGDCGDGTAHTLLRNADTAMYEAKRSGRRRSVVFDDAMHARLSRAMQIEAGLRHAIERAEFTVLYQPIVDLDSGRMSSVEALLRWRHPELGAVSPAEFIPIAEDSGQIITIGEWVLRQACLQWTAWQRTSPEAAPGGVSVNLSRVQMMLGNQLLLVVQAALTEAGMPPSALQLEITEREVLNDPAAARELMLGLKAMGVRLAMDDFGTGASSLGCLRDYPFDVIKIDKSFVTDLGRDRLVLAVAHATVKVIENLGMTSVAEGIEAPEEVAMLQAMGCRYGQGYLFARPMAEDKLIEAMAPPA